MSSRDKILADVRANQPPWKHLPDLPQTTTGAGLVARFSETLNSIGAQVHFVDGYDEIIPLITHIYGTDKRIIAMNPLFAVIAEIQSMYSAPATLADVELMILETTLAVAENGAVWITGDQLTERVLPFIARNCSVVVKQEAIVADMHQAYEQIGTDDYGFGSFIAGPSKTADIEQSLVLGAHGPCSMTVFII